MFSLTLIIFAVVIFVPGGRGHWVLQPRRIDQAQERLSLWIALVDPQMFVGAIVFDSLVLESGVEYLKSTKVIKCQIAILYHNEEVIYLNFI